MSTRSYIAKQIGDNKYRTIYCHNDGYLTYNGAMLLDHYNSPEKLDELLRLGDLSCLGVNINPDPSRPHSFDHKERQDGVTVAYGRDRGDRNVAARNLTLEQLDNPNNWTAYVYIFTQDHEWKYFKAGHSQEGLRDVENDLKNAYAVYDMERPQEYYGNLTDDIAASLKEEQAWNDPSEPDLSM